jgi:hypothetical protein
MQERLMNIQASLVSNNQPPELAEPGKGALHHPPVSTQPLATLHSSASYARCGSSLPQYSSASLEVIPFVRVHFAGSLPSASTQVTRLPDRLDSVEHVGQSVGVVDVGRSTDYRERNSFGAIWRFVAGFPLSAGLGPVHSPLFLPVHSHYLQQHATSLSSRHLPTY